MNQDAPTPWIAEPPAAVSARSSNPPQTEKLLRLRWLLYAVAAIAALVPALWQWPAAYPWVHGSPCVTETAAAQTAQAEGLSEPRLESTVPGACVNLATLVARRDAESRP